MEYLRSMSNAHDVSSIESSVDEFMAVQQKNDTAERARIEAEITAKENQLKQLRDEIEAMKSNAHTSQSDFLAGNEPLTPQEIVAHRSILTNLARLGLKDHEAESVHYTREHDSDFGGGWVEDRKQTVQKGLGMYVVDWFVARTNSASDGVTSSLITKNRLLVGENSAVGMAYTPDSDLTRRPLSSTMSSAQFSEILSAQHLRLMMSSVEETVEVGLRARFFEEAKNIIESSVWSVEETGDYRVIKRLEIEADAGERLGLSTLRYIHDDGTPYPDIHRLEVYSISEHEDGRKYIMNARGLQDEAGSFDFAKDTLSRIKMILKDQML